MQFLKSIFCLQGYDNRSRFLAICVAVYIIFIMLTSAFIGKFFISFLLLILFSVILALTCLRRLHDAKLNKNWLFAPSLTFALAAIGIIFSQQHSSYYLLIIPALCSAVLLTYPSKFNLKSSRKQSYTLGYIGPVDLSEFQQATHQGKEAKFRIEPSLVSESSIALDYDEQTATQTNQVERSYLSNNDDNQADIGEIIRLKFTGNKKAQLLIAIAVTLTVLSIVISWLITYTNTDALPNVNDDIKTKAAMLLVREHPLAMPDNFTLFLSEYQGVIINWQANDVNSTELWSQLSAQGDKSCQSISFSKDKLIRTLNVKVDSNTQYFASFSPLDSKALIQALAFKDSFSLCGYDFSLKGSQATLGKSKHYAGWIEY